MRIANEMPELFDFTPDQARDIELADIKAEIAVKIGANLHQSHLTTLDPANDPAPSGERNGVPIGYEDRVNY